MPIVIKWFIELVLIFTVLVFLAYVPIIKNRKGK